MYAFTLLGIISSKYIPLWKAEAQFTISFSWSYFIISCVIAFAMLTGVEFAGGRDTSGRKINYIRRAVSAVAYGFMVERFIGGLS